MKKLLTVAMGAILLCGVAGCGASYDKTVLAVSGDDAEKSFHAVGGFGGVDGTWSPTEANKMEATSVAEVAKLDKKLAKTLSQKTALQYLYKAEVTIGGECADWKAKAKVNGEIKEFPASHAVKALRAKYDSEDKTYVNDQWIPDPKTAHAESLTENLFISPNWAETPDEEGWHWDMNPVCITEDGTYTLIVAQYTSANTPDSFGFGLGLVKKA